MTVRADVGLVIVTCMELPSDQLMRLLSQGFTPLGVCANAGGLVTRDVLRTVARLRARHEEIQVAVVHHADCTAATSPVTTDKGRDAQSPPWSTLAADATVSVGRALRGLVDSGVLQRGDAVVGLVYDRRARQLTVVTVEPV
jgi:carbonic anhydrase